MGTVTFLSVTYASVFIVWLKAPIIEEFRAHILLCKRFLGDIFMIWYVSFAELYFRTKLSQSTIERLYLQYCWTGKACHQLEALCVQQEQAEHSQASQLQNKTCVGWVLVLLIQETWEHLCVSPVWLSFMGWLWLAQSKNAQSAHTLKQCKHLAWGVL